MDEKRESIAVAILPSFENVAAAKKWFLAESEALIEFHIISISIEN